MTKNDLLNQVERGYRTQKPENSIFQCPDSYYDTMLWCWDKQPDKRPTFRLLYDNFDDFFTTTDPIVRTLG
jgi:hypothetical protein